MLLLKSKMIRSSLFKATVIVVIAMFLCTGVFAQKQEIDAYFSALRNDQSATAPSFTSKKEEQYVRALTPYLRDTIPTLRAEAYSLLSNLGRQSKQKGLRRDIVNLLITGWHDMDWGIHGVVDNALVHFQRQDFDHTALDSIKSRLNILPASPGKLFKLIGYLDLRDLAPKIKSYVEEPQSSLNKASRWAGYISLARLGDQQAIDFLLNRLRTLGLNDDVVYDLFPDLVYTRTFRAIRYLEEGLLSNEKSCGPPSAESDEPVICAYRIMEMIAPAIKDYPVAIGPGGNLEANDYAKALETVRAWFKQKNGNYEIIRDTY